jgi:hypothetical protein
VAHYVVYYGANVNIFALVTPPNCTVLTIKINTLFLPNSFHLHAAPFPFISGCLSGTNFVWSFTKSILHQRVLWVVEIAKDAIRHRFMRGLNPSEKAVFIEPFVYSFGDIERK